jgi:putative ABC transport system permease protein
VALVFGVLLANSSLLGTTESTVRGVIGDARLQLSARSDQGLAQAFASRVRRMPGVQAAAPVLQESATVVGPKGRAHVQIVGVTPSLVTLGGSIPQDIGAGPLLVAGGLGLPSAVAKTIGVRPEQSVSVLADGIAHAVRVSAIAGPNVLGAAADSPIVVALIGVAQRITDRPGRVTQVFVRPDPGKDRVVKDELLRMAAGRLNVAAADNELTALRAIARPSDQATTMFALIGAMVGFLFTFNAMLLTVPERRRYMADLRMQGYDWRQVLIILGFDATFLGITASIVGVVFGYVLSHSLFHSVPVYLSFAFPIGDHQSVQPLLVLLAIVCGTLATLFASLLPAFDIRPKRVRDAVFTQVEGTGEGLSERVAIGFGVAGLVVILIATLLVIIAPRFSLIGGVMLALATILVVPAMFAGTARLLGRTSEYARSSALVLTVRELRTINLSVIALAAVGALAIYGSVAVSGARRDLLAGLDTNFREYLSTADLWVTTGGNDLTTNSFRAGDLQTKIAHLHGISSVRAYQGELMDIGTRRMWIIARPSGDHKIIPASQLLSGKLGRAEEQLRGKGWVAISTGFATEHRLRVGSKFILPSPSGEQVFRVAAITTNVGWPPGAIVLNASDYRHYWRTSAPSALEINLSPGMGAFVGERMVKQLLSSRPGLGVQTRGQREAQYKANSRQAVAALSEISILLLIAAAFAVASTLSATIWRRRLQLASLKLQGYDRYQLWRALLFESAIVLGLGCALGAILGVYGHVLATRWLTLSTGFQARFTLDAPQVLIYLALVAGIGLVVVALPGLAAARVSSRMALQE